MTPFESVSITGRKSVAPEVCNHNLVQLSKSRPDALESSINKSGNSVFFHACLSKYVFKPLRKFSSPTHATSCLKADAPLA